MHSNVKSLMLIALVALVVAVVMASGCATRPTAQYPCPVMLDPVTEETPNVIN